MNQGKSTFKILPYLHSIIDNAPDAVFIHDFDGRILYANKKALSYSGYTQSEMEALTVMEIDAAFPDLDFLQKFWNNLSRDNTKTVYGEHRRKDKSIFPVEIHLSSFNELNTKYILAFVRDITNRKRTEKELQTTQIHYTDFIDKSTDYIGYWKVPEGVSRNLPYEKQVELIIQSECIDANKSFWELYGFKSKKEIIGKKYLEILKDYHKKTLIDFIKNNYNLSDIVYEDTLVRGKKNFGLENWFGVKEKGYLTHIWSSSKNITAQILAERALKDSEERYRIFFDTARDGAFVCNLNGRIIDCNLGFVDLFGYPTKESIMKLNTEDLYSNQEEKNHLIKMIQTKGFVSNHPLSFIKKNGVNTEVLINATIVNVKYNTKSYIQGTVTDTSEQKEAELALHQSYQILETAEKIAKLGSWKWILKTNEVTYSNNALKVYGIKPDKYDGKVESVFKVIHPDDIKMVQKNMADMISVKKPHVFKYRIILPNGEVRNIEGTNKMNFNKQGDITSLFGYIQDVTEKTRKEDIVAARLRLLEFSENHTVIELLREFLDEIEIITDSKIGFYHFLEKDQETISLQTWSTNTLKNMCSAEGDGLHYPVSKAGVWVDCIHKNKTVIHNDYPSLKHKKGLPSGHAPILREMVVPVFRSNKIVAILGVGNKLTNYTEQDARLVEELADLAWEIIERKKANENSEKLSKAVEQSPASIVITDKNGIIEYVNPKFVELTGYKLKEAIGYLPNILKNKSKNKLQQDIWSTITSGNMWNGEYLNKKKGGEEYWVNVRIAPLKDDNGNIINFIIVKENITEKKKILHDLEKAKEKAEESDRLKTAFLNNMSHEIRTPMNGILGFTRMLTKPGTGDEQRSRYSKVISKSSEQLLKIVNDILEIAKIEAGQLKIKEEITDIEEISYNAVNTYKLDAIEKGLDIKINKNPNNSTTIVLIDKQKLIQILDNLLHNSLKFTDKGSIELSYNIKQNEIEFTVSDTGIGIKEDIHQKIFNYFRQAELSITRSYGGTGLGLSICKGLVDIMKGKIHVESTPGVGSTFSFVIPYNKIKLKNKNSDK